MTSYDNEHDQDKDTKDQPTEEKNIQTASSEEVDEINETTTNPTASIEGTPEDKETTVAKRGLSHDAEDIKSGEDTTFDDPEEADPIQHAAQTMNQTEEEKEVAGPIAAASTSSDKDEKAAPKHPAKAEETNASSSKGTKKQKSGWFQTVVSGFIGAVLMFGLITYTPVFDQSTNDSKDAEENFTLNEEQAETTPTATDAVEDSLADMVEDASKAIVGIVNYQKGQNPFAQFSDDVYEGGSGSGVIVKEEGEHAYVVTNNHVIENAEKLEVSMPNGETVEATLIGADALSDLAVLRIDNEHVEKTLSFGDSSKVRAGEQVVAIGNPLGLEFSRTVTKGIVSAVDRTIKTSTSAGEWDLNVIQTDAAINPGNSGGALVNMEGEVIGINSLKIATSNVEGMGFAIPSNEVVPLVEEMVQEGGVSRPYIGISMVDIEQIPRSYLADLPNEVTAGIAVTDIDPESPAGRGGIESGDIIVGMNGEAVETIGDLRNTLYRDLKVGDKVTFELYRGKDKMEVEVTLTSSDME